jgi:hypothetical protein
MEKTNMETQLCEDKTKTLTDQVWGQWQQKGIDSRYLTYIELKHLTEYFLKICTQQNRDPREYDFYTLVDSNLNYYENRAEIENELTGLNSEAETKAANILKDYLTEDELKAYTPQQKNIIEDIETQNKILTKKVGQLTKKMETQQIDPEALKQELDDIQNKMTLMYARFEQIPNLNQLVVALEKSQNFKQVGQAIRPITKFPETKPVDNPAPKKKRGFWNLISKEEIGFLDKLAITCTTLLWGGLTYGAFTSWGFTWQVLVGMALFWVFYPVAIRIVAGGILD